MAEGKSVESGLPLPEITSSISTLVSAAQEQHPGERKNTRYHKADQFI